MGKYSLFINRRLLDNFLIKFKNGSKIQKVGYIKFGTRGDIYKGT